MDIRYQHEITAVEIENEFPTITCKLPESTPDGWHQVLTTWNCEDGIALFVDGHEAAHKKTKFARVQIAQMATGTDFEQRAHDVPEVLIDDIRIYSEPDGCFFPHSGNS